MDRGVFFKSEKEGPQIQAKFGKLKGGGGYLIKLIILQ